MVSIKKALPAISVILMLTACASRPVYDEKPAQRDIYAPIKDDVIEYRDQSDMPGNQQGSGLGANNAGFVDTQIKQVRHLFFAQNYDQASQLAERLVRQAPNNPDAYYWLARIKLETADYQQAYQMSEKGISVSQKGSPVRKALQRLHEQAAIGVN